MTIHLYEFGPFCLDHAKRRLAREGEPVALTPKAFDTLLVLVQNHGSSLTRSELIAQVWPDTSAGEHNLNQCIAVLRKALDDNSRQPTYIVTLPGRGYSFVAEVREVPNGSAGTHEPARVEAVAPVPRAWWTRQAFLVGGGRAYALAGLLLILLAVVPSRWGKVRSAFIPNRPQSVSVLPFANLGTEPQDQYVSEGLSQELAAELGEVPALKVVAAGSRAQANDVDVRTLARELNVGTILKGSVRRSAGQYRIAVELIDGNDGHQLWGQIFSENAPALPAVEEQIVRHTADVLNAPVASDFDQTIARRAGDNPEAHDLYLQARYFWSKRDLLSMKRSFSLYQQAITKDPQYARAYAGLADWYGVMAANQGMNVPEAVRQAKLAANHALELDPTIAEPHAALGLVQSLVDWDWQGAEVEYNRALLLNPGYSTAHHWAGLNLTAMGKFAEADAELKKAQELDPLSPMISEGRMENFYYWHRFDDAMEVLRGMRARESADPSLYALQFSMVETAQGRYEDAYNELRKIDPANSDPNVLALLFSQNSALKGDRQSASATLRRIENKFRPGDPTATTIAFVYAALGEPDQAILWLNRSYRQHDPMMAGIRWHPNLDSLKDDPRFIALTSQVEGKQLSAKN